MIAERQADIVSSGNDRGLEAGDGRPDQGADQRRARLEKPQSLMRRCQEKT